MEPITRDAVLAYAKNTLDVTPQYLWEKYPDYAVLRHGRSGKWFALVMAIAPEKLGLPGENPVDALVVKCDPLMVGSLLGTPGYRPAYHMNKEHWITVLLDGSVPMGDVQGLLELGYDLTRKKPKRKASD